MPTASKAVLKSYFLTGAKPTQLQFASLIDSFALITDLADGTKSLELVQDLQAGAPLNRPAGTVQMLAGQTLLCSIFYADVTGTGAYLKAVFSYLGGVLVVTLLDKLMGAGIADVTLSTLAGGVVEIRPLMDVGTVRGTLRISGALVRA